MKTAFKEWAAVCSALGSGRSILILRRGGVAEPDGAFRPGKGTFLLFPTQFHQSASQLAVWARGENCAAPPAGSVDIALCATAEDSFPVRDAASLAKLRGLHAWSDAVAKERLERGGDSPLWAIPVRVATLAAPKRIAMRESYGGCRSWIELEEDVDVKGARAVMGDAEFEEKRRAIRGALR